MDVRIGLCGFTMAMEDYALYFPVVEVQHTFYEPPRDEVMQRWRAVTPPALEFTMKVWQLVTHAAGSPTYRRMKRPLPADAIPGFFRDSAAVAEGWGCQAVLATDRPLHVIVTRHGSSYAESERRRIRRVLT